jgi:hypothetical protein
VVTRKNGIVPVAELGGRSSRTGSGVTVLHALCSRANTLDDGVEDGLVAIQGGVDDLAVFAVESFLEDFEVEVQTVEVGATIGVGARKDVVGVPVAVNLLIADNGQVVLRAAPRSVERLTVTQNTPRHADGFQNLALEVIKVDRSEGFSCRRSDDAHDGELIFVVTDAEERVDGLADVSTLEHDSSISDGATSGFRSKLIVLLSSGDKKNHLLTSSVAISGENVLCLVEGRSHLISNKRSVVDGTEVSEIVFDFLPQTREATESTTSSVLEDGFLAVTILNETKTETLIRSETTRSSCVGSRNGSEASFSDPFLQEGQESEPAIRMTTNRVGELVEITHDDDQIDGVAVGRTGVLADLERTAPRALGVLGAIARALVSGTLGSQAETKSVVPGAFVRVPSTGSLVGSDFVTLVDGAARRRDGKIPGAAVVFTAENLIGELDTVVFFTDSRRDTGVPGAAFVPVTVD